MAPTTTTRTRVPPGQGVTRGWPVLHVGDVPEFDPTTWTLRVEGEVERGLELGWSELLALPIVRQVADFHCVTAWSRLDCAWEGVRLQELARLAGAHGEAAFVRFSDGRDYDTSLPVETALAGSVLLAHRVDGAPLPPAHGGPLRLVVPSRYGWKSCKWVREIEFLREDKLGFWELRGYHNGADPWREERLV